MASGKDKPIDWDEHRRKLFVEHLSPKTTKDTLREYFSNFEMDACIVPPKDGNNPNSIQFFSNEQITAFLGRNQGFGFIIFCKESSIDTIMSRRPHTIDGQTVELYRSVPDQGVLKEKAGVTELIISNLKRRAISEKDLEKNFGGFGKIVTIKMDPDGDSCTMEYKE